MSDEFHVDSSPGRASAAQLAKLLSGAVRLRAELEDRTPHDVVSDGFSQTIAWSGEHISMYDEIVDPARLERLAEFSQLTVEAVTALKPAFCSPECLAIMSLVWPYLERPMPTQNMYAVKAVHLDLIVWHDGTVSPVLSELYDQMGTLFNRGLSYATVESCLTRSSGPSGHSPGRSASSAGPAAP